MTDKVVSIGRVMPSIGKPDPDIMQMAEELLERAKTGEIRALGIAMVYGGDKIATCWDQGQALSPLLIAATARLHHSVQRAWDAANE